MYGGTSLASFDTMHPIPSNASLDGVPPLSRAPSIAQVTTHAGAMEDVLDFEVHVDLVRLKELACLGIPGELRGKAYPLLLGVAPVDKTAEMTAVRVQLEAYQAIVGPEAMRGKRLKRFLQCQLGARLPGPLKRELVALLLAAPNAAAAAVPQARKQLAVVEGVLAITLPEATVSTTYARGDPAVLPPLELAAVTTSTQVHPAGSTAVQRQYHTPDDGLRLAPSQLPDGRQFSTHHSNGPLTWILYAALLLSSAMDSAPDCFYGVQTVTSVLTSATGYWSPSGLRDEYSLFAMLLHSCCEDVYQHFHVLGINNLRWAPQLLSSLFLDRLPRDELLLVWDHYVAMNDFQLHSYVCLAVIEHWTERLLDSDADDAIELLAGPWPAASLPPTAVLLRSAAKLREEVRDRKLV